MFQLLADSPLILFIVWRLTLSDKRLDDKDEELRESRDFERSLIPKPD